MICWKWMKSMHIGTEHEVIERGSSQASWGGTTVKYHRPWSSSLCSSLENANGLGAAESSLATRFPLTSTERMSVPHARTGRDLCSHQMYIGRNALNVKVCSQIQTMSGSYRRWWRYAKSRVPILEYPPSVSPVLDAGQFAILVLMTVDRNKQSAWYGIK